VRPPIAPPNVAPALRPLIAAITCVLLLDAHPASSNIDNIGIIILIIFLLFLLCEYSESATEKKLFLFFYLIEREYLREFNNRMLLWILFFGGGNNGVA
jgi:hypothetical protein